MAAIDVGILTVGGNNSSSGTTYINITNPAIKKAIIDTVKLSAVVTMSGIKVGSFYHVSGTTYACRDYEAIGNQTAGGLKTITGLSIEFEEGDFIGVFFSEGNIRREIGGGDGIIYSSPAKDLTVISGTTNDSLGFITLYGSGETVSVGGAANLLMHLN